MSKILDATVNASGQVICEGQVILSAQILSEGKQSSSGLLLLEGEKARYVPSSATDIKNTIEKVIANLDQLAPALTTISNALASLAAVPVGSWTPPPVLATAVADLATKVLALNATKAELTTLKGALK